MKRCGHKITHTQSSGAAPSYSLWLQNGRRSIRNGSVARIHVRFAAVSQLSRAVSRLFRVFRAGCLACVSRLFRGCLALLVCGGCADDVVPSIIHPPAKFAIGSKHFEILCELPPPHL